MSSLLGWLLRSTPFAATLAFFGHAFVAQLHQPLGHDVAWLFFVAKSLVAGDRQYADIAEENPPLIVWLYSVPAWVASELDISGVLCLRLFTLLAAGLSLYLANRFLKPLFDPESSVYRHWLICALGYLLTVFPDTSFSQREHLIAMCLAPYLAAVAVRLSRGRENSLHPLFAIGAGLSAGLAVSLKPVFLLAILAPEIVLLWKERSLSPLLRPEMWLFPIVGVAYLLSVQIFTPEYFEVIVPLALDCYPAYQAPFSKVFRFQEPAFLVASFLLARLAVAKADRPLHALAWVLFASGWGCYLAYLMGLTPWTYHLLPIWVANFTLLSLAGVGTLKRLLVGLRVRMSPTPFFSAGAILMAVVGLVLVNRTAVNSSLQLLMQEGDYLTRKSTTDQGFLQFQKFILANTSSRRSVHILSPLMTPAFPLVIHADLDWTSRFGSPWMLPAAAYARAGIRNMNLAPARIQEIEDYFIRSTLDDMIRHEPELVIVEAGKKLPRFKGLGLDYLSMLGRDKRFNVFWRGYRRVGSLNYRERHFNAYRRWPDR